jgi:hypothetical protein
VGHGSKAHLLTAERAKLNRFDTPASLLGDNAKADPPLRFEL